MKLPRSSGILMPVSSLPSKYGIGTFGKAAYEFVDFLEAAKQQYWQILPVGCTSYGDSPYQSFSTFAGNPYFVDLEMLIDDKLLTLKEVEAVDWGSDPENVDYGKIYKNRHRILKKAYKRGIKKYEQDFYYFVCDNAWWIDEYALYMAVKMSFKMVAWSEWPDEAIRRHEWAACQEYKEKLHDEMEVIKFIQFLFFKQWKALKTYANEKGIQIIGDIPIYVAMDSADVWAEPHWFQVDSDNRPVEVSGVPPDYFNEDGQLWGNPLYNYERMKQDGYSWWKRRIYGAYQLYDVIRIDHFRGFESYWAIPYGDTTAKNGHWVKGPGMDLVGELANLAGDKTFIAEDLGYLTEEVHELLRNSSFPGMKVLEFAFDSRESSDYRPHTYPWHSVCYTGTHDNSPIMLWKDEAAAEDMEMARLYLGLNEAEGYNWGMIRGGMSSHSDLFVAQMQDYLGLGEGSRMNKPGFIEGNWRWRMKKGAATKQLAAKIARLVEATGRYNIEK